MKLLTYLDATAWRLHKEFFRALANPARFRMVRLLGDGPRHVGQIAAELGLEQSRVSHNLACLLHCGFVLWNWQGKNKLYRLNPDLVPVLAGMEKHLARYASALESCGVLERESKPIVMAGQAALRRRSARAGRPSFGRRRA